MRQVAKKGLITMAAAGGLLALAGGYAQADSGALGRSAHSPGVGSGNTVQIPVHVPVNVCGNTVNVIGLLNPAFGNKCSNDSGGKHHGSGAKGKASHSPGVVSGNNVQVPVDVPVNACGNSASVGGLLNPAFGNDCDNEPETVPPTSPEYPDNPGEPTPPTEEQPPSPENPDEPDNPDNPEEPEEPGTPGGPETPDSPDSPDSPDNPGTRPQTETEPHTQVVTPPKTAGHLAQTGAGTIGLAVPAAAGLLLGGAVLYRRARTARG
ncbi:chaplin [Streptomyces sp. Pv4-95]|uniref:chaplin n=1 Tax=Streptomyces sp. Pv4-95 TaxID=3049543 RepID=UPI0038923A48